MCRFIFRSVLIFRDSNSESNGGIKEALPPDVAKVEGLQSQGAKRAAEIYCKPLATPDMESSGFPALSWRSSAEPEEQKRWPAIGPILTFTIVLFLTKCSDAV
jgi:hypothetical protein